MEKLLNILIVHNEYQYAGGEDTVVRQDASLLEKHGHSVFFYIRKNDELHHFSKLRKVLLPFTTIFSLKSYREIRQIIRENNIDIVHVHNTLPLVSLSCYYAAKKEKIKLVQTIHNFRFVCPNALFYRDGHICEDCLEKGLLCSIRHNCYRSSKTQTAMVALMLKLHRIAGSFRKPDAYIALTQFNKNKLSVIVPAEKIFVKPNYLSVAKTAQPFADNKDSSPFVYAARLESVKGIFVLLNAFKSLPEENLLILGTGPEEASVKEFIAKHNLTNVTCLGFTPHEEALSLLSKAKALVFPSLWYEGFPMTIVESLSLGIPVIASNTPNIGEIIHTGKNGMLFSTGSSEALSKTIHSFCALPHKEYDAMRQTALKTYQTNFTETVVYRKLMDIYYKIPEKP